MSTFTKVAIPLALALPLAAYVLGTLMAADPAPADHEPIHLEPITLTEPPDPSGQPVGPEESEGDSPPRQPEVVRPTPVEPDDDDDDDDFDDDDDDDSDSDDDDDTDDDDSDDDDD